MIMILDVATMIAGELLFWILYLLFVTVLWLLLFPALLIVATPFFLIRAALHPSGFRAITKLQYARLYDVWVELSIRLIPL